MKIFCIEILGENCFHKVLMQSGWSGKDYAFYYNPATQSHLRAYPRFEDYLAERVDMHKASNIWPLLANWIDQSQLVPEAMVGGPPQPSSRKPAGKGGR